MTALSFTLFTAYQIYLAVISDTNRIGRLIGIAFYLMLTVASFFEKAADADGDGLNIMDATNIQRYLVGFENTYHIDETVTVPDPTTPQPTAPQPTRNPYELPVVVD